MIGFKTRHADCGMITKVSKGAKIRNQYNQVPHLTQDTNGKVTNSQLETTNTSQVDSPFPAGDHKSHINRRVQRQSKHKTAQKHKRSTKKYRLGTVGKIFYWRALTGLTAPVISNPYITFYYLFGLITKIRFSNNSFEFIN